MNEQNIDPLCHPILQMAEGISAFSCPTCALLTTIPQGLHSLLWVLTLSKSAGFNCRSGSSQLKNTNMKHRKQRGDNQWPNHSRTTKRPAVRWKGNGWSKNLENVTIAPRPLKNTTAATHRLHEAAANVQGRAWWKDNGKPGFIMKQ